MLRGVSNNWQTPRIDVLGLRPYSKFPNLLINLQLFSVISYNLDLQGDFFFHFLIGSK